MSCEEDEGEGGRQNPSGFILDHYLVGCAIYAAYRDTKVLAYGFGKPVK